MKKIRMISALVFLFLLAGCAGELYSLKGGDKGIFLKEKSWTPVCRHTAAKAFMVISEDPKCVKAEILAGPSGLEKWHAQSRGTFKESYLGKEYEVIRWVGENRSGHLVTKLQDNFKPELVFKNLWEFDVFLANPDVWYAATQIQKQATNKQGKVLLASRSNKVRLPIMGADKKHKIEKIKPEKNEFFDFEIANLVVPELKMEKQKIEKTKFVEIAKIEIKPVKSIKSVAETKTKKLTAITYEVKRGDSLWKICQNIKTKPLTISNLVSKIVQANQIQEPDLIFPGQIIVIPVLA